MTDMRFLLMKLIEDGDPYHTYMEKSPAGMFTTLGQARECGYQMLHNHEADDFEIYELLENGKFEFIY